MRKRDEIMNVNPEMDCILQHIVDKISYIAEDAEIQKYGKVDMAMKVDAISLYSCDEMHPVTENVYFCRPEHLCGLSSIYQNMVLFCVTNGMPIDPLPEGYRIIVVTSRQSLEFIFNALQKFISNLRIKNLLIDHAILAEKNIQDVLSIGEQILSNPFLLLDANFNLLGWSKMHECTDLLYTETIESGVLPDKYVIRLISQNILRKLYVFGTIVISPNYHLSDSTIVMVILKNEDLIIGYGMMICSRRKARRPMIQGFEKFINKFRTRLSEMKAISYSLKNSEIYFYIMLLKGTVTDRNEIRKCAEELQICRNGEYVLHTIRCRESNSLPLNYAFNIFEKNVVEKETAFAYGKNILIIEDVREQGSGLTEKSAYHKFLADYQAVAGISSSFYHIHEIRNAYLQADSSCRIGETLSRTEESMYFDYSSRIYRYAEYVQYMLIEREYLETKRFPMTCMRLLRMISQDVEKNTDYARTLLVYLQNRCQVNATAKKIFLHRNSVLNRISQISDMLKMDLTLSETTTELLLDFKVIDYAKAVGKMEQLMELIG